MKRKTIQSLSAFVAGLSLLFAVGCGGKAPQTDAKTEPVATTATTAPKPYPLDTCVVADEKLGEMGEPYVFVHEGQEFKLCCKSCLKDFNKEPAKYLQKVQVAKKS